MRLGKPHLEQDQDWGGLMPTSRSRVARLNAAGRSHEAVGDGGPRWMIATDFGRYRIRLTGHLAHLSFSLRPTRCSNPALLCPHGRDDHI